LLRDIGKLMLNEYVSADYKKILEKVNNENLSLSQAEESLFGFDHGYIGAKLLEKWNFPSTLIETVQYHNNFGRAVEDGCENLTLISIVHIADAFTMLTGTGLGSDGMMYYFDLATFKQLGIPENQENIENLLAEIVELKLEVKKLKGMINA
ncbi:MAG: HDOD domain-containing protein, partial [Candidatus Gastranaerophilales bacterium]|nr:HDOD domain-containing protein [Candidatus Gastranaerophilales bacterium]